MRRLVNFSSGAGTLAEFENAADLRAFYMAYGCEGAELILCDGTPGSQWEPGMVRGLHLIFYPEWISLWRGEYDVLDKKFGSRRAWQEFYRAEVGADLLDIYRRELDVAEKLGAEYVVFHIGDNALEEYFTLVPARSNREIIDTSADFLNQLFRGRAPALELLLENLWLGGMDMTDPALTRRMLEKVEYARTGIMLDTGHLMITNPFLRTAEQAVAYIHHILNLHGAELAGCIRGVHLHQSLSGEYLQNFARQVNWQEEGYVGRYGQTMRHLKKVDPHSPFVAAGVPALVQRIAPAYLVYELAHENRAQWQQVLCAQHGVFTEDITCAGGHLHPEAD